MFDIGAATNWPAFLVEDAQGITKSTSFASFYLHNCSFIPVFPVTQYKLLNSIEDKGAQYSHKCLLNTNNLHFNVQGNTLPGYQPLTAIVEVDDTDSSSISAKINTNTNKFYYTGISDNNGRISIPCPFMNSELMDLIIIECQSDAEIITDFTILNQGSTVLLQNQNYPKTMLYFTLQWLPKDVSFPVEATTLKP